MNWWLARSARTQTAMIVAAGLAVVFVTKAWPIAVMILFLAAVVAAVPRVGSRFLASIRWRSVPVVGRTNGLAAAGILLLSSFGLALVGGAVAPVPTSTPTAAQSSAAAPPAAAPTSTATTAPPAASTATSPSAPPTPQPTVAPTPRPPTPTPAPTPFHFGAGQRNVGTDLAPSTYRTRQGAPGCYWERLSGFGGTLGEIIANENTNDPTIVTIAPTDKGFNSTHCAEWTTDLSSITSSLTSPFPDGTYFVGVDIAPGTWHNSGGTGCYWQRMSGFSGGLGDIIANNNVNGPVNVTIGATDKGFKSARCGTWTKVG